MDVRQLIIDEKHPGFLTSGMELFEFPSIFNNIRKYSAEVVQFAPGEFKEVNLLEQQISELIKNGMKHGNRCNPRKKVKLWYEFSIEKKMIRIIVEDEGRGFKNLEHWNSFYRRRCYFIRNLDVAQMMDYITYRTKESTELDGGNALFAAIEYWNGGVYYNNKKNKVLVIKYF